MRILVVLSYIFMVVMNGLATMLPINDMDTREISEMYINLFTPADYAFMIWSLIYLLLLFYVLYQLFAKTETDRQEEAFQQIGWIFIINALLNAMWLITWHYTFIFLALIIIIGMFITLYKIITIIEKFQDDLNTRQNLILSSTFNIYFGWITVASMANFVILLVSFETDLLSVTNPQPIGIAIIIFITVLIATVILKRYSSFYYGGVIIWALVAILVKHASYDGWNREYPIIIAELVILILGYFVCIFYFTIRENL